MKMKLVFFVCVFLMVSTAFVTGQPNIGDALSSMRQAIEEANIEFSTQDEYYLGRAVAADILSRYRPYRGNPELTRYLNLICRSIQVNSTRPEPFNGYYVMILDSTEYNAFATPGGHIFITKALVEAAPSEDALAAIIAHEMAHIMLNHGMSVVYDMRLTSQLDAAAERAAAMAGTAQRAAELRNTVSILINTMLQSGYSQTLEFEADREALALLAATGYDPAALIEMLRILQRTQGSRQGGFNSTHPTPAQRISNLESVIRQYRVRNTRPSRVQRFENSR